MRMSDLVAQYILNMLEAQDGSAEIRRNELAGSLGCVPSQINYVITSRFTPEQGYIVRDDSELDGSGYKEHQLFRYLLCVSEAFDSEDVTQS